MARTSYRFAAEAVGRIKFWSNQYSEGFPVAESPHPPANEDCDFYCSQVVPKLLRSLR